MNAVGSFGQFIIDNQFAIDALLLILLAAIVIYWLYKRIIASKPKDALTSEVNTVSDAAISELSKANSAAIAELSKKLDLIESEVKGIARNKEESSKEVLKQEAEPEMDIQVAPDAAVDADVEADADTDTDTDVEVEAEADTDVEVEAAQEAGLDRVQGDSEEPTDLKNMQLENEQPISQLQSLFSMPQKKAKFSSRNWNEDRFGNQYSEEELKKLIN